MEETRITALLLNWKRPENLKIVINSIRNQSVPIQICLWNNNQEDQNIYDVDLQINSSENFKCWPRWMFGSLVESDFIFTLDDDIRFTDEKVIEDILNYYLNKKESKKNLIVGYAGVILNNSLDYWKSSHINSPTEKDLEVDIVKGRFMFMQSSLLSNLSLENEPTCEDIKVSSVSKYKLIPGFLKDRLCNLDELGVGLFGTSDHEVKREEATKKYFKNLRTDDLNSLSSLMRLYGSDKGGCGRFSCHNYTNFYEMVFSPIRYKENLVFEMGLGTNNQAISFNMGPQGKPGASLRAWRDYFPNSKIYGADIDRGILFRETGIQTFYCDQTSEESISELWSNMELMDVKFDIIIDDGLHNYKANLCFFKNSAHKLKTNGIYIIEDLNQESLEFFKSSEYSLSEEFPGLEFTIFQIFHTKNNHDNNIMVVRKKF